MQRSTIFVSYGQLSGRAALSSGECAPSRTLWVAGPAHRGVMREALTVMYPGWGAGARKLRAVFAFVPTELGRRRNQKRPCCGLWGQQRGRLRPSDRRLTDDAPMFASVHQII